jgi:hypothetical protein
VADFQSHIIQSQHNFSVLGQLNAKVSNSIDWQITICFYTALHLIDAYLAKEGNIHYNKHIEVRKAIWFDEPLSLLKLPEDICLAYRSLENLSRKARYLCSDIDGQREKEKAIAHIVKDKDLYKALKKCGVIIEYFANKYPEEVRFETIKMMCKEATIGTKIPFIQF